MATSIYVFQPGDIIYVQADGKSPMRSYQVQTNGVLREVVYDQVGPDPVRSGSSAYNPPPVMPASTSSSNPFGKPSPLDTTRSFSRNNP